MPVNQTPEEYFTANCGRIPPLFGCINGVSYFVPNAFTPNNDGFNDIFVPFTGEGINEVVSFKVFDESGTLVFEKYNFPPNNLPYGWDGKLPDGSLQDGIFTYTVSFETPLGETQELAGSVCCRTSSPLACVDHEKHIAWGTEHNGNGGFDSALPSFEECE